MDLSWLYRLSAEYFADEETGAWHAVLEANGFYSANDDTELLLTPGIMYEAHGQTVQAFVL